MKLYDSSKSTCLACACEHNFALQAWSRHAKLEALHLKPKSTLRLPSFQQKVQARQSSFHSRLPSIRPTNTLIPSIHSFHKDTKTKKCESSSSRSQQDASSSIARSPRPQPPQPAPHPSPIALSIAQTAHGRIGNALRQAGKRP